MERDTLIDLIARHTSSEGITPTPIEGLRLFCITQPMECLPAVYPASMCYVVTGSKRAYYGGSSFTYDPEHFLCATTPLPVEAEVIHASPESPVMGFLVDLDTRAMSETLIAYEAAARPAPPSEGDDPSQGLLLTRVDQRFTTASVRLLQLLDDPVALRVLATGRLQELLFTLIDGEAGPRVRGNLGAGSEITRALNHLHENLAEPISVADMAATAGMSRAVFHRRFKDATGHSPLQFIKALRLSHAAMQIVGGRGITQAAMDVGYNSPSQFSREFKRQFGETPREWTRAAAASAPDVQARSAS